MRTAPAPSAISLLVAAAALIVAPAMAGQPRAAGASSKQTVVHTFNSQSAPADMVSPAVLASWLVHRDAGNALVFDLAILWRDSPGWFFSGAVNGGSSGGSATQTHWSFQRGGIERTASYDARTRTASVQGQQIALKDANVILVDNVTSEKDLKIVDTLTVEAGGLESPFRIQSILRRSPKVVTYLRCDAVLPQPQFQAVMSTICASVIAK